MLAYLVLHQAPSPVQISLQVPTSGFRIALSQGLHQAVVVQGAWRPLLGAVVGHGDTHIHRVDRPLKDPRSGKPLANFTRAEVFGSPDVNWLQVRVSENSGRLQFSISPGR